MSQEAEKDSGPDDEGKRTFLKIAVTASVVLAAGGVAAIAKSLVNPALGVSSPPTQFPRVKVASMGNLVVNQPVSFNYPLDNEPNILVKLGQKADGGIGPDGDIIAFSQVCQHLGCLYAFQAQGSSPPCSASYKADRPVGYCCCHGTVYDFGHQAQVISGPSPRPLPRVILELNSSGDIFATGMTPPTIFGHNTGSNDAASDLQGGNLVA
ncbi:MAG: arsenate reductase (azurin) small subunit [Thaumarchaeota archaeon]|nr:arsenate reductase (azurin) small subunit [Nitrososphaerota archaeon]